MAADGYELVKPVYEEMSGWNDVTYGATSLEQLPEAAIAYIKRIEEITGVPIHIVSTGPDRNETMVLVNPYDL
jgi:adenylosuccinate synthase